MIKKYSIWLISTEKTRQYLKTKEDYLRKIYSGDEFIPHVTILGEICGEEVELIDSLLRVLDKTKLSNLVMQDVSFSTTFFQSIFIRIKPTAELLELNMHLKTMFHSENDFFVPHISLLYGIEEMKIREQAAAQIKLEIFDYEIESIGLVEVGGNIKDFKIVCTFPIGGNSLSGIVDY